MCMQTPLGLLKVITSLRDNIVGVPLGKYFSGQHSMQDSSGESNFS